MAGARSCWLVTSTRDGGVDARPMGRLQAEPGDDAWLIRFITDSRSHKAADIKRAAKVAVIFEVPADDAYFTLVGRAAVKDSAADVRRLWKAAYDAFFPSETDKANAIFVEIAADRLELWRPSRSRRRRRCSSAGPAATGGSLRARASVP
jgi:general stress protein 26